MLVKYLSYTDTQHYCSETTFLFQTGVYSSSFCGQHLERDQVQADKLSFYGMVFGNIEGLASIGLWKLVDLLKSKIFKLKRAW